MRACKRSKAPRGAVVVQVAVLSTVLVGAAALSIDVGAMYAARAELQNAADAAAMAAAAQLADYSQGSPLAQARAVAITYAGLNQVFGDGLTITNADVTFGRGVLEASGKYRFVPGGPLPDAVRVTVRRTASSPDGPIPLLFARIWGCGDKDMWARATAMLIPRDIAIVADLSGSHNYDSQLRHYRITEVNNWAVWAALPIPSGNNGVGNGLDPAPPGNPTQNDGPGTGPGNPGNQGGNPDPGADPQMAGPTWGFMRDLGWGQLQIDPDTYDPNADPGLAHLPQGSNWSNPVLQDALFAQGYSAQEVNFIMQATGHNWKSRVAVALGLAVWNSGLSGGLWQQAGLPPGDGDARVDSGEITWLYDYPYSGGSWFEYMDYVRSRYSPMYSANSAFRYKFGLKTFIDYLRVKRRRYVDTPVLAATPVQPM
ncbi:MAG: TadG family pilus assembly protein, partial [Phycisphaerae bacterium]